VAALCVVAAVARATPGLVNEQRTAEPRLVESPNYVAALAEVGLVLGLGTAWYAFETKANAQDWAYEYSWETLKKKLISGEAVKTDSNPLYLNSPGHPLAGASYYLVARYNGFSPWGSFWVTNLASTAWELAAEFREEMSINDLLMTPVGGFAIGESIYALTRFLAEAHRSHPVTTRSSALFPGLDQEGYPYDTWYRFGLVLGAEGHANPQSALGGYLGFESMLLKSASYDRAGVEQRSIGSPFASRLNLRVKLGERGVEQGRIRAEITYLGLYAQRVEPQGPEVAGTEGYLGLSAMFHHQEEHRAAFDDQLGAVSLFGVEGHAAALRGPWRLRATAQVYPVFAGIRSIAWAERAAAVSAPFERAAPPVLVNWLYYWAGGFAAGGQVSVEFRLRAWLTWETRSYHLSPVEDWVDRPHPGADRADVHLTHTLSLTHALPWNHLWARVMIEGTWRDSTYGTIRVTHDDLRAQVAMVWGASR
jgi:hypothetical protein